MGWTSGGSRIRPKIGGAKEASADLTFLSIRRCAGPDPRHVLSLNRSCDGDSGRPHRLPRVLVLRQLLVLVRPELGLQVVEECNGGGRQEHDPIHHQRRQLDPELVVRHHLDAARALAVVHGGAAPGVRPTPEEQQD